MPDTCKWCNVEGGRRGFYVNPKTNRRNSECRGCMLERSRKYRATEQGKRNQKLYNGSKAKVLANKRYNATSKARTTWSAWATKKKASDPQFRMRRALSRRIRNALAKWRTGKTTFTMALTGTTTKGFVDHIEKRWKPNMSWDNYGHGPGLWQIDHIKPLASFDLTDPEQQKSAFHFSNQQPLWQVENTSKSDKMPDGSRGRDLRARSTM